MSDEIQWSPSIWEKEPEWGYLAEILFPDGEVITARVTSEPVERGAVCLWRDRRAVYLSGNQYLALHKLPGKP